jgi:hypothetical protein
VIGYGAIKMRLRREIHVMIAFILLIFAILLTYLYPIPMVMAIYLVLLGGWIFITGIFEKGKEYEVFIKTPTNRVVFGGFILAIGVPLITYLTLHDARIALVNLIIVITLTLFVAMYTERKR